MIKSYDWIALAEQVESGVVFFLWAALLIGFFSEKESDGRIQDAGAHHRLGMPGFRPRTRVIL
jgi:hypothetical protein